MEDMSDIIFNNAYSKVFNSVIKEGVPQKNHCVIFLGGQPGSGKSHFCYQDNSLNSYIVINGDKYRSFHPDYFNIIEYDLDNYVERTQPFVNRCIERLISDLSDKGYNMIIEGTLRDPNVPINTCRQLKSKGYIADLYVMGVDACTSWQSTINRADIIMLCLDEAPRLVPIDKYNNIVNNLPGNLDIIEHSGLFRNISVIDRDNKILYPNDKGLSASATLKSALNLDEWNKSFNKAADRFIDEKVAVLEKQRKRKGR